jgi:nitrous oxide reductase
MDGKMVASRREALGLASLAAAAVTFGATATAASAGKKSDDARPTQAELERAKRLYGGEFGGGRSAR